jgi:hypothetical protein
MVGNLTVTETRPVPSGQSGRAGSGSCLVSALTAPKRSRQPEFLGLLGAFWDDTASADGASGTRRAERHRNAPPDPA